MLLGMAERQQIQYEPPTIRRHDPNLDATRMLDVVGALIGSVVLAVPALLIALAVKLTSSGPVIYRQRRVGRDGDEFEMLKFRSMRVGTHEGIMSDPCQRARFEVAEFKLPANDPRITSAGRVIRRLSLDEIPQLVNVLRSEMSLVGIRAVERSQLELRSEADQAMYRSLRPGITGLWQIEGRSSSHPRERAELDRHYVATRSLWGDLRILMRTTVAVFRVSRTA